MRFDSPLALIAFTMTTFAAGTWLYQRLGKLPVLQPVLVAIVSTSIVLYATGLSYPVYLERTTALHSLLGPAIVALALPLHDNLRKARSLLPAVLGTLLVAGTLVTGSALVLGWALGLDGPMQISLTTKSVTAPIALAVAEKIGGAVPLTILSVFTTGVVGVMITPLLLELMRVQSPIVRGFTLGLTSHVFGIARSLELGPEAVAFATLGMALMGCGTAVIVPAIFRFL